MSDQNEKIEQHVGLVETDAFEITTDGTTETGKRLYADGGDGKEKEATVLSSHAGASSEAPASSGIPSAMTQHGVPLQSSPNAETPMVGRAIPGKQNVEP